MSREIPDAQLSHSRPSSCSTRETELLNVSAVLVVFLRSLKRLGELDTRIRYQSSRVCGNGKLVRSCFAALVTGKGGCTGVGREDDSSTVVEERVQLCRLKMWIQAEGMHYLPYRAVTQLWSAYTLAVDGLPSTSRTTSD